MTTMKTILAFSDTHGAPLPSRLLSVARESDLVFFLGDGLGGLRELADHPGLYAVKGNCDFLPSPDELTLDVEGVRVFLTHGHLYGVKTDLLNLSLRAEELGCSLAFFGHTHIAETVPRGGLTLINPGSAARPAYGVPTYAYTVVNGKKAVATLVEL